VGEAASAGITWPPASVLVVDDTIDNLRLLSNMLTEEGYEIRPVTNGRQALRAVEQDLPDLILLDIGMPDMDGYQVARKLRANERSRNIPVIFLTALSDTADKVRAFEAGGMDYITKPFQIEEVLARVRTYVALGRAQRALAASYEHLRGLEKLRDNLVHMIIHDMRTPLQVMLIHLGLVQRSEVPLTAETHLDLEAAAEAARAVDRMANDLLDVSRFEAGKMPVHLGTWDLARLAREVCAKVGAMDPGRRIDIDSAGPVAVVCDGALVRRVMENLVTNGMQHTPIGSPLRISLTSDARGVRVAVQDCGRGVPEAARGRIFEKFGTVETREAQQYHSAGLGLAFCRLAIEAQGGSIGVDAGVPKGSTFWFELPA